MSKPKRIHRSNAYLEALEKHTPKCESRNFIPPSTLTSEELKVWEQLANTFKEMPNHPACDLDVHTMEMYCYTKVARDNFLEELNKNSDYYIVVDTGMTDKQGNPKKVLRVNPNYKLLKDYNALLDKLANELCITQKSRVKYGITAAKNNQDDESMSILESIMNRSDD